MIQKTDADHEAMQDVHNRAELAATAAAEAVLANMQQRLSKTPLRATFLLSMTPCYWKLLGRLSILPLDTGYTSNECQNDKLLKELQNVCPFIRLLLFQLQIRMTDIGT